MSEIIAGIVVTKSIIFALGALITYFAYKAYMETGSSALRALAVGFALVTVGTLIAGVLDQALRIDILISVLVQSALTALGFGVITYSLYTE